MTLMGDIFLVSASSQTLFRIDRIFYCTLPFYTHHDVTLSSTVVVSETVRFKPVHFRSQILVSPAFLSFVNTITKSSVCVKSNVHNTANVHVLPITSELLSHALHVSLFYFFCTELSKYESIVNIFNKFQLRYNRGIH